MTRHRPEPISPEAPRQRRAIGALLAAAAPVVGLAIVTARPASSGGGTAAAGQAPARSTAAMPAGAVELRIELREPGGRLVPAEDAAIWLEGASAAEARPPDQAKPRIAQRNKRFEPHVEIVPVGTVVAFPNFDRVYHNVFSLSEIATFDLGLYRNGASRSVTFTKPGVVRIYCNIHPHMAAFLVVVPSELFAKTDGRGSARIDGVPPGRYRLKVWHEMSDETSRDVEVASGRATTVRMQLDGSRFQLQPHTNKYGKAYPPPDDDANRY